MPNHVMLTAQKARQTTKMHKKGVDSKRPLSSSHLYTIHRKCTPQDRIITHTHGKEKTDSHTHRHARSLSHLAADQPLDEAAYGGTGDNEPHRLSASGEVGVKIAHSGVALLLDHQHRPRGDAEVIPGEKMCEEPTK